MRGEIDLQVGLLTLTTPEKRVPADHPIRQIKRLADAALKKIDPVFDAMYAQMGRPSTRPERLLKAQLLIAFYSIRSERQFCERLDYDLLFRFFLDMSLDEASWDPSTFAKNRDRLVEHEVSKQFFEEIVRAAKTARLLSAEHFTVDGTLIEAWASLKSFRRKDEKPEDRRPPDGKGNPSVDFRGEKRSNTTHESTTDASGRSSGSSSATTPAAAASRPRPLPPTGPNHVWAYDFVFDTSATGQQIKCLTVIDEWTREALAIDVAGSIRAGRVIDVLSRLVSARGAPRYLRSDNGPEFVSSAILR